MNIEKVQYMNWKGVSGDMEFDDGMAVLSGPNGSGKTARMLGLQFALTGTTPLGSRIQDAAPFSDGSSCSVGVSLSDGFTFGRKIIVQNGRTRQCIWSSETDDGANIETVHAAIREHCGAFVANVRVSAFLAMTPERRREFIAAECGRASSGDIGRPSVAVAAHAINRIIVEAFREPLSLDGWSAGKMGRPIDDLTVDELATVAEYVRQQPDAAGVSWLSVDAANTHTDAGLSEIDAISRVLEEIRSRLSVCRKSATATKQAQRRIIAARNAITRPPQSRAQLEQELTNIRQQRSDLIEQVGRQDGRQAAITSRESAIDTCDRNIAQTESNIRTLEGQPDAPTEQAAAEMRSKAESLQGEYAASKAEIERLAEDNRKVEAKWGHAQERLLQLRKEEADALAAATKSQAAVSVIEGSMDDWLKMASLLEQCWREHPKGTLPELLHQARMIVERHCSQEVRDRLADARADANLTLAEVERATDAIRSHDVYIEECASAKAASSGALSAATEAMRQRETPEQWASKAEAIESEIHARRLKLDRLRKSLAEWAHQREENTRELHKLMSESITVSRDDLLSQVSMLDKRADELLAAVEQRSKWDSLDAQCAAGLVAANEQAEVFDCLNRLVKAAQRVRAMSMQSMSGLMEGTMNKCLMGMEVRSMKAYCNLCDADGAMQIGLAIITRGNVHRVPVEMLSGGERAVFMAALGFALLKMANPPLKVLTIEAGEIDGPSLSVLCGCLRKCLDAKSVDCVVVSTHLAAHSIEKIPCLQVLPGRVG